ncbi:MAG: PAS domain S-box protein [Oscillospiraceae bacterium]|nr:PAS domain S-box protein [Oscillospiraceae bacterium]
MSETVKTNHELCTGCNRCVRECPMETPNITYQDENGEIKVKIDHEKCITCGRCVSACRHEARYFIDDTTRFFDDLEAGAPISLVVAPSIRTNMPEYKKLFSYLRNKGIRKIYDVSFGADICTWAHIKHVEKIGDAHLITQPCPAIVKYCEIYKHELLENLSPIHSPMGCTCVYVKEYDGNTDSIAALTPCVAKSNEFEETGLAQYNVTFKKLLEYLESNDIQLPNEETEFDRAGDGIGALYPMPGGLKENIEFYLGKKVSIDREEGHYVYERLNTYAESPSELLPNIFDVLNCHEGCNVGTACVDNGNVFAINRVMDISRSIATENRDRSFYEEVYKAYDDKLDVAHFMREYHPIDITIPQISDDDIEKALETLGKTDYERQHIDCGACGSDTCRGMARKIALGINLPANCIVRAIESAKTEHEQLLDMEKLHESDRRMQTLLDETNAKLDAVISNYPGVIWSVDKDETITLFKGLYLDEIGVTPSFLEGKTLDAARVKGRHLDIIQKIKETIEDGPQDWISDIEGKRFHSRTTPIFDDNDEVTGVVGSIDDVTEMVELQERLKEENLYMLEQFEMIWDKVESGIVIVDAATREIIDANPAAVALYGGDKANMIGKICYTLFGQHECPIMDEGKNMDRAERMFIKADGSSIPVLKSAAQIQFKGKPAMLESFTDISPMKEAEAQRSMLQSGERVRILLDANPHINILFDSNIRILDCNPAAIAFMGFDTKEEMLAGFAERLTGAVPEIMSNGRRARPIPEYFVTAIKEGTNRFETELVLAGSRRRINVELKRIPYEDSYAVVGYIIDMTDVYEREMELAHARELNELQLLKLNLAAKATKIGLWDMEIVSDDPVNPNNAFVWSDEFRQMLGYKDENDFPSVFKSWIDRLHPEDKEGAIDAFARHLMDETGKTPFDIEYRLMKKDGEYSYYRASGETIRDEHGTALRVAGALMDITETKNILLDTERHRIEAEAANKAKSAFLSTMSHEIRTPMNAILGITEIQLQKDTIENGVREAFDKIYTSGDMLLGIINDILDLSKIEAGKLELIIDRYETASLVSDTAQLNMMRIGSKPIEFELYIDENLPAHLVGDELRVKQILNNLLSNAFKYTESGTVKLMIDKDDNAENDDVTIIFSVSDTGQGMTEEQVNRLFDEYSRFNVETNRTTEGTGLGMSITRNLVQMMHGRIDIKSKPGEGSTFTVYLPQGRSGTSILGKESADNLHKFRTRSRAQMKRVQIAREPMPYGSVLIVDDVETNIYVARGLLAPYGLMIDSADSGFAAIEKIKNGSVYDIVFMDHMMPKMDGVEATKIIRQMGYKESIVALTANAVSGQAEIFLGNGFNDFIAKPIDVRQLNGVLNRLIRDKQPPEVLEAARKQAESRTDKPKEGEAIALDPRFAEVFVRDAVKSLEVLETIVNKGSDCSEDDMRTYVIHVHGMKSALANIGKMELSAIALKLETSGRDGDLNILNNETQIFLDSLRAVVEELTPKKDLGADVVDEDPEFLRAKLSALKEACDEYDETAMESILAELDGMQWSDSTRALLSSLSEHILHSDFDEIADMLPKYLS